MKLEQIDTSTTAGKAEVMRLAAEGRRVAERGINCTEPFYERLGGRKIGWNWESRSYAIIVDDVVPIGPEEVWLVIELYRASEEETKQYASENGFNVAKYIRADLAGEVKE